MGSSPSKKQKNLFTIYLSRPMELSACFLGNLASDRIADVSTGIRQKSCSHLLINKKPQSSEEAWGSRSQTERYTCAAIYPERARPPFPSEGHQHLGPGQVSWLAASLTLCAFPSFGTLRTVASSRFQYRLQLRGSNGLALYTP